jgi:recombination protein RecT
VANNDHKALIQSDAAKRQISLALPDHISSDRYSRAVLSAINKTPKLLNCSQQSFVNSVMQCAELGLEPNGRDAHFIPYGSQCQLVVDYKGLIKLAYQSGQVSSIRADVVYHGDEFDYSTCDHIPWGWRVDAPPKRGGCIGAYVVIDKKDGSVHRERMTFDEIEGIRKRSKAGTSGPWVTDWDEMAKKTVFRRASKWIQLSPHLDRALDFDHDTPDFDAERRGVKRSVSTEDLLGKPEPVAEELDDDAIDHDDLES